MRRVVIVIAFATVAFCFLELSQFVSAADGTNNADTSAAAPADRVVVMYFHRTKRCPTCRRMGGYSEEAVVKGFPEQIKDGTVEFRFIDFQDKQNAALTNGYKVSGPTLIVAHVVDNKVKEFKTLTEIWAKNGDKDEFLKYVRNNVITYQKSESQTAKKPESAESTEKAE